MAVFVAGDSVDLFGRVYGPRGRLMNRKPTFIWEVWSTDPSEITGATATIGEETLQTRYDPVGKRVLAELNRPLTPGKHAVKLSALLKEGQPVSKDWVIEVATDALERLPVTSESQLRTLGEVNRFRDALGLPLCQMDDYLNAASLQHSRYLAQNKTTGHYQKEDTPGFFGHDPVARLEAFGYVQDSWETVEFGALREEEAIQNLIDAPYHRLPFLQPGALRFGSGYETQRLTATFSVSKEEGVVFYPADEQVGVKTTWSKNERPNPLRIHQNVRYPLGYPIVFAYFSPTKKALKVRVAKLSDEAGADVPCHVNTPENDNELKYAAFLIPQRPLKPNTKHFARIEASVEDGPDVSRIWSFTTGPR